MAPLNVEFVCKVGNVAGLDFSDTARMAAIANRQPVTSVRTLATMANVNPSMLGDLIDTARFVARNPGLE